MPNYLSVIKDLERGVELCALCGKDITDLPNCLHPKKYYGTDTTTSVTYDVWTPAGVSQAIQRSTTCYSLGSRDLAMRIGIEMILDIPYLRSLPLCDPDPSIGLRFTNLGLLTRPS